MQEVGQSSSFHNSDIDLIRRVPQEWTGAGDISDGRSQTINRHFSGREVLSKTVVQLARDAPPLIVLSPHETPGEPPQVIFRLFQLARFSMKFREHPDLGSKELGDD